MIKKSDNIIGWWGALLVVGAYALLILTGITHDNILYNMMNLAGGLALGYRVWVDRNYSNLFLEIVFVGVAIFALLRVLL